jgi:L-histidine N-alpha-methyltransferase
MTVTTLLDPDDLREGLIDDARIGLTSRPPWLPPKYFYDARGSELFDKITTLPEYYPTRTERSILRQWAPDIARAAHAEVLLELGSGSSEKTGWLLDAMESAGHLDAYVPVDVSPAALAGAVAGLAESRPGLPVFPVVADFERHLAELPRPGRRLVAFLGSTIGNFMPPERARFLASLAKALEPGESVLIGLDLVKDPKRLVAAYDDAYGVTAEFNLNVLHVLNRELGADFEVDGFRHRAVWDPVNEWIEMRLRATRAMRVSVPALELSIDVADGAEIRTEISSKFRRPGVAAELSSAGFTPVGWWADPAEDFALALATRPATAS